MPTKALILVVGGAGFIGSHMVLLLKEAGFTPIVLDNLSTGHQKNVLGEHLVVGDVSDSACLEQLLTTYSFLAVMHFASCLDIAESTRLPLKYYHNNVAASVCLLEKMVQHHVPYFIFSSSASVYGEPHYTPLDEKHPLLPSHPYGRSKKIVEEMIQDVADSHGLRYAILRYFNAAGCDPLGRLREEHEPESHLIPLILQVAQGKRSQIKLYGNDYPTPDGTCVRDYVHVLDICRAHLLALQALMAGEPSMICNVGSGAGWSVQQVLDKARIVTERAIVTQHAPRRLGDPAILVADNQLAKKRLHWQLQYEDLSLMIQHAWQVLL